jgi:exopolysaccharide production protein ExoZ
MKNKLLSIQALRAIAATGVVWLHSAETILKDAPHPVLPIAPVWFRLGASGVDIFFVISGFVIFFIAPELPVGWDRRAGFLKDRAIRVYPIYLVFTLLTTLFFMFRGVRAKLTLKYFIASCLLFPVTSPIDGGFHPILDQGWTLFYEVGFYLLFALLLFWDLRRRLTGIFVALASLYVIAHLGSGLPQFIAIWQDAIIFEFVLGCSIAYLYRSGRLPTGYIALGTMLLGWLLLAASTQFPPVWNRFLFWGLPSALVVAGAIGFEVSPRDQARWFSWLSPGGRLLFSLPVPYPLCLRAWLPGQAKRIWSILVQADVGGAALHRHMHRYGLDRPSHHRKTAHAAAEREA